MTDKRFLTSFGFCFAILSLAHDAAAFRISIKAGEWKRHKLGFMTTGKEKTWTETENFVIPGGPCRMTFEKDPWRPVSTWYMDWKCEPADARACRNSGVAIYRKKDGKLGLDYYRTSLGYNHRALARFCAGKGVTMSKAVGKEVKFTWKPPAKTSLTPPQKERRFIETEATLPQFLAVDTNQVVKEPAENDELDENDDDK